MSVSSIGSSSSTTADALQQQLKADQKTLTEDQAKKASQETLQADQAKVTADQQAITGAQDKTKHAKLASDGKDVAAKAHPSATSDVAGSSTGASSSTSATSTGGVDITV
jgi:hypothetical protein